MKLELEKIKYFKNLPEEYKTDKFLKLYSRMYEYILSIPKEKIIIKKITKHNNYIPYLTKYISAFLEAKDFYHWKDRIYSLLTEKIHSTEYRKFELLYSSKAYYFHKLYSSKVSNSIKTICLERYGEEYYTQTEECKEQYKAICEKKYGPGITNAFQAKEVKEKIKEKCLERYGVEYTCLLYDHISHSKEADLLFDIIDRKLGYPYDSYYAKKNKEFSLKTEDGHLRKYDYCILSKKIIIEFDGNYWHALDKNPDDIINLHGKLILAKEIHEYDKEKEELAMQNGYKVFHIRENEYKKNSELVINNIVELIQNI